MTEYSPAEVQLPAKNVLLAALIVAIAASIALVVPNAGKPVATPVALFTPG